MCCKSGSTRDVCRVVTAEARAGVLSQEAPVVPSKLAAR